MRILKHAFISQFDLMPVSVKNGFPWFEKKKKIEKGPFLVQKSKWSLHNVLTTHHESHSISRRELISLLCTATRWAPQLILASFVKSLKLNVMQIRSLKRRTQRWAGLRFLRDNAAISPPRKMNPVQRITYSVIFSAWSHRFSYRKGFCRKKKMYRFIFTM